MILIFLLINLFFLGRVYFGAGVLRGFSRFACALCQRSFLPCGRTYDGESSRTLHRATPVLIGPCSVILVVSARVSHQAVRDRWPCLDGMVPVGSPVFGIGLYRFSIPIGQNLKVNHFFRAVGIRVAVCCFFKYSTIFQDTCCLSVFEPACAYSLNFVLKNINFLLSWNPVANEVLRNGCS